MTFGVDAPVLPRPTYSVEQHVEFWGKKIHRVNEVNDDGFFFR